MTLEFERQIANVCSRVANRQGEHIRIKLREALWNNRASLQATLAQMASGELGARHFESAITREKNKLLELLSKDNSLSGKQISMLVTTLLFELAKEKLGDTASS